MKYSMMCHVVLLPYPTFSQILMEFVKNVPKSNVVCVHIVSVVKVKDVPIKYTSMMMPQIKDNCTKAMNTQRMSSTNNKTIIFENDQMGIVNPLLRLHSKKRQSLRNLLSGGIKEHSRASSPHSVFLLSPILQLM